MTRESSYHHTQWKQLSLGMNIPSSKLQAFSKISSLVYKKSEAFSVQIILMVHTTITTEIAFVKETKHLVVARRMGRPHEIYMDEFKGV